MLDAFIIKEIKRREEQRDDASRPQPHLPSSSNEREDRPRRRSETEDEGPQRGVIVIDLAVVNRPA